ncbi:MAG: hypothetical protein SangKO_047590 [Sandaracinaceae bacterium]
MLAKIEAADAAALPSLAQEAAQAGLTLAWAEAAADRPSAEALSSFAAIWHPADEALASSWARAAEAMEAPLPDDVADAEKRHTRRQRKRDKARRAPAGSPLVDAWLGSPVLLRVRCGACGRDACHEVGTALFDPSEAVTDAATLHLGVYVPFILACPFCDAEDDYSLSIPSAQEIATRAAAAARMRRDFPVRVGKAGLADGTSIRRPSEGLRILRARAEEQGGGERWRALGNFALRAGRADEALEAFERGAEDPAELACALAVAAEALGREDGEPGPLVARAVSRVPLAEEKWRPQLCAEVAEALRKLLPRTEKPLRLRMVGRRGAATVDVRAIKDWARLGELLAISVEASLTFDYAPAAELDRAAGVL